MDKKKKKKKSHISSVKNKQKLGKAQWAFSALFLHTLFMFLERLFF